MRQGMSATDPKNYSLLKTIVMRFFLSDLFETKQQDHRDESKTLVFNEPPHNITDGSEFLDDAIRMHEQPFLDLHTEKSIAPGNPDGLW